MVILVSDNVRYMFRDSLEVVTIEQELNYVKNYLRIQELGMARNVECHMQVDTEALNVKIPPLTIQTFVENSVKHGADHFEKFRDKPDYFYIENGFCTAIRYNRI